MLCTLYLGMYRDQRGTEVAEITAEFYVVWPDPQLGPYVEFCERIEVYRDKSKVYEGSQAQKIWSFLEPRMVGTWDQEFDFFQKLEKSWMLVLNDRPVPAIGLRR